MKQMKNVIYLTATILILSFISCDSSGEDKHRSEAIGSADSLKATMAPDTSYDDETTSAPPTPEDSNNRGPASVPENPQASFASLCYSFFTKMTVDESKDINVFLNKEKDASQLLTEIRQEVSEQENETIENIENDSQSCIKIPVYKSISIKLLDLDDAFNIKEQTEAKQLIDNLDNNTWRWTISPKSDIKIKEPRLTIKIIAETTEGSTKQLKDKDIKIKIQVNPNIFWRIINYLMENPEYLLTVLIVPIVKYFFNLMKKKKEE